MGSDSGAESFDSDDFEIQRRKEKKQKRKQKELHDMQ